MKTDEDQITILLPKGVTTLTVPPVKGSKHKQVKLPRVKCTHEAHMLSNGPLTLVPVPFLAFIFCSCLAEWEHLSPITFTEGQGKMNWQGTKESNHNKTYTRNRAEQWRWI